MVSPHRCHSNLTRGVGRFREILRAVESRTTQSLRMVSEPACQLSAIAEACAADGSNTPILSSLSFPFCRHRLLEQLQCCVCPHGGSTAPVQRDE